MNILAIETSCDETSASIIKDGKIEVSTVINSQMDIHKAYGGVVPEIASRHHVENITLVIEEVLEKSKMNIESIDAFAVTYGPGLIGSLLIGLEAAKTLSLIYNKPLIPVHHISGHIYANNLVGSLKFPLICLVISGGHTEILYMKDNYKYKILGSTLDDAVGEAYDKVARVLDFEYPGGPVVDKLSEKGVDSYVLPMPLDDDTYNFSFSGLKSAVINLINKEKMKKNDIRKEDLCASFQNIIVKTLVKKTMRAVKQYKVKQLLLAGGVSANKQIRKTFEEECNKINIELLVPPIKYCTDNAAMIGCSAFYKKVKKNDYKINPKSVERLK